MAKLETMDGNQAAAYASYAFTEVAPIYPITPSTPMAELIDEWSSHGMKNIFGHPVEVVEMQSEAGAAGTMHGALSVGALSTTYTASQGLLLMIPNIYKMVGELLPGVFHVSARALATHALSIFGDHQDVMACRQTGIAMLSSSNVQEVMDLALVAHLSAIKSRMPFIHFFDGFRTSHEYQKIEVIEPKDAAKLLDQDELKGFRLRSLTPDNPKAKGTAQNPDIYFQMCETKNRFYDAVPNNVEQYMNEIKKLTGREYHLFDYYGSPDAESIVVAVGSVCDTINEVVDYLIKKGEKVGVIRVRLYRPFSEAHLLNAVPKTVKRIAVLDRTKEPGAPGEPLYLDVVKAFYNNSSKPLIVGGRYGLGMKDTRPSQILSVFDNLKSPSPKDSFTIGIVDDITFKSLPEAEAIETVPEGTISCKFWGLGSDGTVGANKTAIKIIGDNTKMYVQGYFSYDSKKSGGTTVSHLRFGKNPIKSPYLVYSADYIACHNTSFVNHYDILKGIKKGGTFLLNCPWGTDELSQKLPASLKKYMALNAINFYTIDAVKIALEIGLGNRINMIMQAAFFKLSNVIPINNAAIYLKDSIEKMYSKKGKNIVDMNKLAVDKGISSIVKIDVPASWKETAEQKPNNLNHYPVPEFVDKIQSRMACLEGDDLPVSVFVGMEDGSFPLGTTSYEKRGIAVMLPEWQMDKCIQCNLCSYICPHATVRPFLLDEGESKSAPENFRTKQAVGKDLEKYKYRIQVSPLDCTGCGNCSDICPAKGKAVIMKPAENAIETESENWEFAMSLAEKNVMSKETIKGSQFARPLLEFNGACPGCGETPYIRLLTQLFGEKMIVANATGCSSIWGASAPSIAYTTNSNGKGPAWANSLFEDNAEFALGLGGRFSKKRSVWAIGGDGWAYDIGFGGVDHVLASGKNINLFVMDTEVYSNTGGQSSKSTPTAAVAKFAASGKKTRKKDLGLMMMTYGYVYVAQIAMGANPAHTIKAILEAESYDGPSLIIAYAPCINHGIKAGMGNSIAEEKKAVEAGYWHLYRFDPRLKAQGKNPFQLDSGEPTGSFRDFLMGEVRYSQLASTFPEKAEGLFDEAKRNADERYETYKKLGKRDD